jgi:hypothetical protein
MVINSKEQAMFITGDEIKAIYELEFESYEIERVEDADFTDLKPLRVVGSFGGRSETYVIKTNEDYEIASVEKVA